MNSHDASPAVAQDAVGAADAADVRTAARAALIALDWGTTSLRAYLFGASGDVLATRTSPAGIMNLPSAPEDGGFDAAFDDACGAWLAAAPGLPVIAAGMVGSAQGWVQAPYIETPASVESLAAAVVRVRTARGSTIAVVPGVLKSGVLPDVMRGEETQILGALQPGEGAGGPSWQSALICLPGTHAKWVEVEDGRIERFHTFMTGEVYAALTAHTILGRTMKRPAEPNLAAFARGVTVAREHGETGLLGTAFSSRALALTGQLAADEQPDYLSGLLIGHELAGLTAMLAERGVALRMSEPRLIGTDALCERYRVALAQFGCTNAHTVRHATERGLWRIATQAGLVTPA